MLLSLQQPFTAPNITGAAWLSAEEWCLTQSPSPLQPCWWHGSGTQHPLEHFRRPAYKFVHPEAPPHCPPPEGGRAGCLGSTAPSPPGPTGDPAPPWVENSPLPGDCPDLEACGLLASLFPEVWLLGISTETSPAREPFPAWPLRGKQAEARLHDSRGSSSHILCFSQGRRRPPWRPSSFPGSPC